MELKQITEKTFYIPGLINIGLYLEGNQVILIDSGNDEWTGRKIYRILEKQGWNLRTIINTHSNADHIGGNNYLQKKTNCDIAATSIESTFIEHPNLEPFLLWGAYPFKSLRNKFLQAQPSRVTCIIKDDGPITGTHLTAFPLAGHFLQMIGIRTPDEVYFLADSLFSSEIFEKYTLTVCADVEAMLKTYLLLEKMEGKFFIPSHAKLTNNIQDLIKINRGHLLKMSSSVASLCDKPISREDILATLARNHNIELSSSQFILTLITISAHLSYLFDQKVIHPIFENGKMLWQKL
ncbi:MAG: MBL fold metallo-hydrolase [Atribacterota bacterium]|nr:MBL fold metallo-hydrolase [Atribacterota bacterium]